MGEDGRLRIAFAAGQRYDGGPEYGPGFEDLCTPSVTASSESDQWLADEMNLSLEARLSARRVLFDLQCRVGRGRAPYAPRMVPEYGPEALGQAVCDLGHPVFGGVSIDTWGGIVIDVTAPGREVRWVQSVPAVRVERLNVVDVKAREV